MLAQNSDKQQISINIENQQFKYNNRDGKKEITSFTYAVDTINNEIDIESLKRKIKSITQYQKPYISKLFREVLDKNLENAKIICEYIIAEQNELTSSDIASLSWVPLRV
jgi:hypothetical protein